MRGTHNTNSEIKFETSMLKSSSCDYSDAHVLAKRNISFENLTTSGTSAINDKSI